MSPHMSPHTTVRWGRMARQTLLWIFTLTVVGVPLWLVLVTAAKPYAEAQQLSLSLPRQWHMAQNFGTVFADGNAVRGFLNSCLVTLPAIGLLLFFGAMAAWAQ